MEDYNTNSIMKVNTIHYYRWADRPVIYDDEYTTAFQYRNGKWSIIDRHSFDDYADSIVDDKELHQFFTEKIMMEYQKFVNETFNQMITERSRNIADVFGNNKSLFHK